MVINKDTRKDRTCICEVCKQPGDPFGFNARGHKCHRCYQLDRKMNEQIKDANK